MPDVPTAAPGAPAAGLVARTNFADEADADADAPAALADALGAFWMQPESVTVRL